MAINVCRQRRTTGWRECLDEYLEQEEPAGAVSKRLYHNLL
jgi:hypothetical protein